MNNSEERKNPRVGNTVKSDLVRKFIFHNPTAPKYLLRWNKNYFPLLEIYFGEPSTFVEGFKIIWQTEDRNFSYRAIYFADEMRLDLHETLIGATRWKLIASEQYPPEPVIKRFAAWLKGTQPNADRKQIKFEKESAGDVHQQNGR